MYVLGISAYYHDSAACIVRDGEIIAAAQEERFTRKKHDDEFPREAIKYCLAEAGVTIADIECVAFYDKPFLKFERLLETYLAYAPKGIRSFLKAMPIWITKKLWIKDLIRKELGYDGKIFFPEHHMSHAASAFYPSPFQEAAFLTVDGVGEWTTTSYGVGEGNTLTVQADIQFPHSLGLLYSAFTYYTGFKVNSGEYKLMGLAPYGEPKYKNLIYEHLIHVKVDGSFHLNMDYFNYAAGLTMTNKRFNDLFGAPARKPEAALTQFYKDIARSIQDVTEEIILKMARHVRKTTGKRHLCLAGGVALNCVANGKLLRENIFDDIWIQPAAGDAGGALGAALFVWHHALGNERMADNKHDTMQGAYLGPCYSDSEIKTSLDMIGASYSRLDDTALYNRVADYIANEKVVGWFQGRMEFGPRALGNRSILGDARSPEMQKIMNLKIKFRESFRPFAPSVLEEDVSKYFALNNNSPYMLLVADAKTRLPATTHVDGSARVQTVNRETNPRYHLLLSTFKNRHSTSAVINTSFNVRGEPIVCTSEDAYQCFMRTNMDYLVLGNYLLDKKEQPNWIEHTDWQKEYALD